MHLKVLNRCFQNYEIVGINKNYLSRLMNKYLYIIEFDEGNNRETYDGE